jgi:hypothetical protein
VKRLQRVLGAHLKKFESAFGEIDITQDAPPEQLN